MNRAMRWAAVVLLAPMLLVLGSCVAWVVVGATRASASEVIEVEKPVMCVSEELGVNMPCAYLIALLQKQRGGDPFCSLHACPRRI